MVKPNDDLISRKRNKMIIECEICGSWTHMNEAPLNKICPICLSIGTLFIQENPTEEQKKPPKEE